ncbi:hypothetical protein G7B40_035110 [Aetokthonos hydrillicola Thurmond2011]|uniref:Endo-beta-1,6-galactanase-like domain-containing protein n=1 Tax=Aetokthonos hydrillicola Thurmond2011 TaxID=2712845 RepID=A0AAP5MBY6_9CYAN|nr:hypothetical protein [Aetokthonos hydrillicola]MBW4590422.1 hypothetical protein [Aetokthonos hydrillicola CCALA 1050]MDR9899750.1 hypothetical protein [Aetokthonos hydrillicola Thurmond2011]
MSVLIASLGGGAAQADYTAKINSKSNGKWKGWGTSLAWWAKAFGNRSNLADIIFSQPTSTPVKYQPDYGTTVSLPSLGLNIVRYNAGASYNAKAPSKHTAGPSTTAVTPTKQIDGYWLDWSSSDPQSDSWDWSANSDSNQRNMMWLARDRGADHFELFSNSPMWWMLYNQNPAGADNATSDNLQSWNWQAHAIYLATIAKYAHDHWGINFDSVEPFNEPSSNFWSATGWNSNSGYPSDQEGSHFDHSTQMSVIQYLRSELDKRGLNWMAVSASDENTYDEAYNTFYDFGFLNNGTGVTNNVGRINVHGYQGTGGRRDLLYSLAQQYGKEIWDSEYGDNDASGMTMATIINYDFYWLHPTAWIYWQALDGLNWGLIKADNISGQTQDVNEKYFVFAQYTRHIREGMSILSSNDVNTVVGYDSTKHKLVIVTTNYGNGQWINYDLSAYNTVTGNNGWVDRWATNTNGGDQYTYHKDTSLHGKVFWSWFPPNTVQTFEVNGVQ